MSAPERKSSVLGGGGENNHRRSVADRRHKKGECPTCGNRTHKIGLFGKRTALTVEGSCLYGRCLLCNPVEGYQRRVSQPQQEAPALHTTAPPVMESGCISNLVIDATKPDDIPDDGTMVSGITMDHRLIVGARNWNGELEEDEFYMQEDDDDESFEGGAWAANANRPEPSVGGMDGDDMIRKPPERRARPDNTTSFHSRPMAPPKRGSAGDGAAVFAGNYRSSLTDVPENDDKSRSVGNTMRSSNTEGDSSMPQRSTHSSSNSNNRYHPPQPPPSNHDLSVEDIYRQAQMYDSSQYIPPDPIRHEEKSEIQDRGASNSNPAQWKSTPNEYALNSNSNLPTPSQHDIHVANSQAPVVNASGFRKSFGNLMDDDDDLSEPPMHEETPDFRRDLQAIEPSQQFRRDSEEQHHAPASNSMLSSSTDNYSPPRPKANRMASKGGSVWSRDSTDDLITGPVKAAPSPAAAASPPLPAAAAAAPPLVDRSKRGMPDDDFTEGIAAGTSPPTNGGGGGNVRNSNNNINVRKAANEALPSDEGKDGPQATLEDIPDIIASLDQGNHVRGFQSLAELVMAYGQVAKIKMRESSGIETLVQCMWNDMSNAAVMEAACELLFALSASADGNPDSDILVGESADLAVDALLITMQTHISQQAIQQSGCGTLHCLATASSNNPDVRDGTLSGAVYTVTNAMEMLPNAQEVQEWGIRALYSQCFLSTHAEANKKNLAQSGNIDVIRKAMETAKKDLVTVELACLLYWSLAANEDVARVLMETPGPVKAITKAVQSYHKRPEGVAMTEAAFGAMANLARVCDEQDYFREGGVIEQVIGSLQTFHYNENIYIEACALLGVLGLDGRNAEKLTNCEAVENINKVTKNYSRNLEIQEEALWALICIASGSEQAKMALATEAHISSLLRQVRGSNFSKDYQQMVCMLVASLCALKQGAEIFVSSGGFDILMGLLKDHPSDTKFHEIVFVIFRNISSHGMGVNMFLNFHAAKLVLNGMILTLESTETQINACCTIWNVCAKANKDPSAFVDAGAIANVVKAMQEHMESGELLEMACGALWCLMDQSDARKKELLGCGAIDAVTCALVMHPKEPLTLEKACGLLANVCTTSIMAEAIADSQGISMVVEALGSNSNSMKLLELGTLVLRNMVLTAQRNAAEASNGISTIINCMRNNPDEVGFQREACNALWAMAAQSEDCKNKILALDGVTALMAALDHNSCVGDVQDAARGAIYQLNSSNR